MRKGWNRTLNLLLKNSFKNTFASYGVVIGLTLLIALLSLIISLMTSISTRVVGNYEELKTASNLRDAVIDLDPGVFVGKDKEADGAPDNVVESQQYYIYKLSEKYENTNYDFSWSRTEARNFSGLNNQKNPLTVKAISKFTPNTSPENVDSLTISEGRNIDQTDSKKAAREVVIDATFAQLNKVHIGDVIRIQEDSLGDQLKVKDPLNDIDSATRDKINLISDLNDPNDEFNKEFSTYKWLQVVGLGESADFAMPIVSDQTPLPNKDTELICYIDPSNFGLITDESRPNQGFKYFDQARSTYSVASSSDEEAYYSIKFKNHKFSPTKSDIDKINRDFVTMVGKDNGGTANPQFIYLNTDKDYKYSNRTNAIAETIKIYQIISSVILIIVLVVVVFSIVLVTRKQIDKTRSQIGVMKALGYEKRQVLFNYISLPFITSLCGGIIGFIIAQAIQGPIIGLFKTYFNLDISNWSFDILGFFVTVVIMWFVISAVSFLIAFSVMRHDTLELLTAAKASHISKFGRWIKSLNPAKTTTSQMKAALLASNSGKMLSVSLIVLLATIIMTASFMTPTMLNQNKTKSYTGVKYKQLVEYSDPVYNNPYTFMKTYDTSVTYENQVFNYSDALQKITSKPLSADGNYDMKTIMNQLSTGMVANEYYDLEFGASATSADKKTGLPNTIEALTANMKMLNPYGVTLSNSYFKTISDWAMPDSFGWNILSNQWPDYLNMTQALRNNEEKYSGKQLLVEDALQLQSMYKKYTEAVGLTISRDLYNYDSTGKDAYESHDYEKQIQLFNSENNEIANSNLSNKKTAFTRYRNENTGTTPSFGKVLASDPQLALNSDFSISDGKENKNIAINHILGKNKTQNSKVDLYLATDFTSDSLQESDLRSYISDYLSWWGAFFSQRSGTAIVAAATSRPPYFVQQYLKKAYTANSPDSIYNFSFSTVPYDPNIEQLGTELKAQATDLSNKILDFKIYGVQNNDKFMDLRDSSNNNLMSQLFSSSSDDDEPGIVINESLAKKLNIKKDDVIDLDVLYNELQAYNNGQSKAFDTTDWHQTGVRGQTKDSKNNGFITTNDMDTFAVSATNPITGQSKNMTRGSANVTNEPGDLYKDFLAGNIGNESKKKQQTFKVVGVHNGYGTPAAWIKNDNAEKIMNFDQAREYLWKTLFAQQFASEFTNETKYGSTGNVMPGAYFNRDLRDVDYQTFVDFYLNNADSEYHEAALKINNIFNNAYPIFNFKYSLNDDIGDIKSGVSTYTALGDYSPITMNGGIAENVTYDGIGVGSIGGILPVQISKDILNQMSSVVLAVIIIIITLVVALTFIIIMLTTTLIISDNMRFISTMKVLGYTNTDIVNIVLGMYAIAIVIMFAIGFVIGWFMLFGVVNSLALSTSFVLPLTFPWWLLFAVMLAVCGIYIITFVVGFNRVAKAKPIAVLQNQEI